MFGCTVCIFIQKRMFEDSAHQTQPSAAHQKKTANNYKSTRHYYLYI